MGEKWLYEVRTIRYIVVLPIVIFTGEGGGVGGPLSDRYNLFIICYMDIPYLSRFHNII